MVISPIVKQIFTEEESRDILKFLKEKTIAYHRPYKRYNKIVKVPRGQASFTFMYIKIIKTFSRLTKTTKMVG